MSNRSVLGEMMRIVRCLLISVFLAPVARAAPKGFPPLPDFNRRVDYVAWYERASQEGVTDNAYPLYAEFMPGFSGSDVSEADWPAFSGMLTDEDAPPAPLPWDPAMHPQWEASYQRTRDVLKRFAAAAKKKHLVVPSDLTIGVDSARNLLQNMGRHHLRYLVQCSKGTLEAAWRMNDRTVSPKRMLSAIQTNLRVVRQFERSLFAVEYATADKIRMLTYDHVAWALAHGVLSEKHIKKLRKILQKVDGRPVDVSRALRGEAALLLDGLQYMYGPLGGGGRPKLNGNRYREVTGQSMGGANRLGLGARLESDVPGTARTILDACVKVEALMGPTYEERRMHDIMTLMDKMEKSSNTMKAMRFNLGGRMGDTYVTNVRCETRRRATQLLVELFTYKAKKGKWPKKLSNLSKKVRKRAAADPFGRGPFGYRRTGDGPLLYTVSRNGEDDGGQHVEGFGAFGRSGDVVFWPIPDGARILAAGRLLQTRETDLTPISAIGPDWKGKTVTVAAEVSAVSSEPSPEYGRIYIVTLAQDDHTLECVYDRSLAKRLSPRQDVQPGRHVRITAVVMEVDGHCRLQLQNANDLVVED